jgi:tetratricopeptide (TPR) repeat protein
MPGLKIFCVSMLIILMASPAAFSQVDNAEVERLYSKGQELVKQRLYYDAADTLKLAFSEDPSHFRTILLLGEVYLRLGNLPGAEQAFNQIREQQPQMTMGYLKLAELYWHWERYELALEYLKTASQLSDPPEPEVISWRGQILRSQNKLAESDSVLREGLKLYPDNPVLLANFGITLTYMGDPMKARVFLDSAYHIDSSQVFVVNSLVSYHLMMENLPRATEYLERAIQIDPDDPFTRSNKLAQALAFKSFTAREHFQEGNYNFQKALYRKARESYLKALEEDSLIFEVYVNLGFTNIHLGIPDQAAEAFAKAVEFHPDYVPAWIGWGDALLGLNEPDSALLKYQKALELDPNNATVKQIMEEIKTAMREMEKPGE